MSVEQNMMFMTYLDIKKVLKINGKDISTYKARELFKKYRARRVDKKLVEFNPRYLPTEWLLKAISNDFGISYELLLSNLEDTKKDTQ
ncbi:MULTISPECIES: hypothetical protein [unclassified Breznakia]|uniref:hypothetical protein n=1 Tax=unclassified Breznakia TaxID=2623764 RepID=UPI002474CB06|nr:MULTISPECIES: hypothetical protein [unclassified Breznakia]MDH6367163.1 hypothetical protein [Breznakia sp. PH1-1]MDH6404417.1 hypothetical protein [Breznakia sp. PF1-11]MDH6412126.1 hypothetical protein [Breznakia sp. PFB1-11]MDH6414405.1 hypothetical protein [Breznakia sp. PFB1-14]MDH6416665.1 hypothetical protein [Breznakia sp. PFB1-4]